MHNVTVTHTRYWTSGDVVGVSVNAMMPKPSKIKMTSLWGCRGRLPCDCCEICTYRYTLQLVEREIPPVLDDELQVSDVAMHWNADAMARNQSLAEMCTNDVSPSSSSSTNSSQTGPPCSLAFVAAPVGTVKSPRALNEYLKTFTTANDGWSGQQDIKNGWQNKLGYVAGKAGASVSLQIEKTPTKVKTIILHTF
jgi:hypothetical protein